LSRGRITTRSPLTISEEINKGVGQVHAVDVHGVVPARPRRVRPMLASREPALAAASRARRQCLSPWWCGVCASCCGRLGREAPAARPP
jgi:hypothetical protein